MNLIFVSMSIYSIYNIVKSKTPNPNVTVSSRCKEHHCLFVSAHWKLNIQLPLNKN